MRNAVNNPSQAQGTMFSRPMRSTWTAWPTTGYISNDVPSAGWGRGSLARWGAPSLRPSGRELYMYDPTDPLTWNDMK